MEYNLKSFFISGWQHIVDLHAYDHLLFIIALCAAFQLKQWRQVLIIITAFTLGHSVTLLLSALNLVTIDAHLVETLIPLTIIVTCISNVLPYKEGSTVSNVKVKYLFAMIFGLIHGLAYATSLQVMLLGGDILTPLFIFNLGIEVGQLFIVSLFMIALWIYTRLLKGNHNNWKLFVSGAGCGIALMILMGVTPHTH